MLCIQQWLISVTGQLRARVRLPWVCGIILFTVVKLPSSTTNRLRWAGWKWASPGEILPAWATTEHGKERRDEKLAGGREDRGRGTGKRRTQSLSLATFP